jgi:hypothetical protein
MPNHRLRALSLLVLAAAGCGPTASGTGEPPGGVSRALGGALTYDAQTNMSHSTGGADRGGWDLWSNGFISTANASPGNPVLTAGATTLTVTAFADVAQGTGAHMIVTVGGTQIGAAYVNATSFKDYPFSFTATAGAQEVRVQFDNDYFGGAGGADRNLIVKTVVIQSVVGGCPAAGGESPNGTTITTVGPAITDAAGAQWTLTAGGQIAVNGTVDPITAHVVQLVYVDHVVWQENAAGNWYSWTGSSWQEHGMTPPPGLGIDPCAGITCGGHGTCDASSGAAQCSCEAGYQTSGLTCVPQTQHPSGGFSVSNGRIYDSNGNEFIARGVNILDAELGTVSSSEIHSLMPQVNFIRLACGFGNGISDAQPIPVLQSWIDEVTAAGIVVMIDNHVGDQRSAGSLDFGEEAAWFSSLASIYMNNPYVWFESGNELNYPVSAEHKNVYDAVRGTGNGNLVVFCVPTGGGSTSTGDNAPDNPGVYASMTNVVWDHHWYNWMTGGDGNQGNVDNLLASTISGYQATAPSADGPMPVIMGETGFLNYTGGCGGSSAVDANGGCGTNEIVLSVETTGTTAGSGYAIWLWAGAFMFGNAATDLVDQGSNTLTSHGQFLVQNM